MKTSTKQILLIVALVVASVIFYSFSKPQDAPDKYLTMLCYREIWIIDENGKMEIIRLPKLDENEKRAVLVTKTINDLSAKGYELLFMTERMDVERYMFKKK